MADVLIAYDRRKAQTLVERWFEDATEARRERLALEIASLDQPDLEVVLLEAQTREDVRVSHARYFDPLAIGVDRLFPPTLKGSS